MDRQSDQDPQHEPRAKRYKGGSGPTKLAVGSADQGEDDQQRQLMKSLKAAADQARISSSRETSSGDDDYSSCPMISSTNTAAVAAAGKLTTMQQKENEKPSCILMQTSEPPCTTSSAAAAASNKQVDYVHVRARRGQATDSHSLAERVRSTSSDFAQSTQIYSLFIMIFEELASWLL